MDRRNFLTALAALTTGACQPEAPLPPPTSRFVGYDPAYAHRLRSMRFPPPDDTRKHGVLILGGGIAGLSAAWRLKRAGYTDFALYEMNEQVGGNARAGGNVISRYPLGAHYLPLPPTEARAVRTMLADLGVLRSGLTNVQPEYDERYLCHAPQERLYRNGKWQEGIVPAHDLTDEEATQMRSFFADMQRFKQARGTDGRRAFTVPRAYASQDPLFTALDKLSMAKWMQQRGYTATPLHWYVDYACRDDFGTRHTQTSAWAGIHYFSCRSDSGELADVVLTAPEGNGWITEALSSRLQAHLNTEAMAIRMGQLPNGTPYADVFLPLQDRTVRIEARQIICALPLMVARRIWAERPSALDNYMRSLEYAPWLVANLSLRAEPRERSGAPPAWDNVLYDSPGLGYVNATHQSLRTRPGPTVLTYYLALADNPSASRRLLLGRSHSEWSAEIIKELTRLHPDLPNLVSEVEIARYGHAMVQPRPGVVWSRERTAMLRAVAGRGPLHLAHSDMSGFSIFEEANYHGVHAAEAALRALGKQGTSLL